MVTRIRGILLALTIGISVVALGFGVPSVITGNFSFRGAVGAAPYFLLLALWIAAPFIILALARVTTHGPWVIGIALTIVVWVIFLVVAYTLAERDAETAIGYGALIFASPLMISIICIALAFARPKQSGRHLEG